MIENITNKYTLKNFLYINNGFQSIKNLNTSSK